MGLSERRRIAELKNKFEEFQPKLSEMVGQDLPLSFDFSTVPEDEAVISTLESYADYTLAMVVKIFKSITVDDLGKEAVRAKLRSVTVLNTSKTADDPGEKAVSINEDGTLVIKFGFYRYSDNIWSEDDLLKSIEKML